MKTIDDPKVNCNGCNHETNHIVRASYKADILDLYEDDGLRHAIKYGENIFQIIQCKGCNTVSYRSVNWVDEFAERNSLTGDFEIQSDKIIEQLYPERMQDSITPKHIPALPTHILKVYQEVIQCYNKDLRIVCSAGMRAIIEGICKHIKVEGENLGKKIDSLKNKSLITGDLAKSLINNKILGDNALHWLEVPKKREIQLAVELLEMALETIFGVPAKVNEQNTFTENRLRRTNP